HASAAVGAGGTTGTTNAAPAPHATGAVNPMATAGPMDEYDVSGVDADIAPRLMAAVSPRRFWHCKQVADLAASLAERWGLDADGARRAGLLHDYSRDQRKEWLAMAAAEGIALPAWAGNDIG